ncbi:MULTISPECIES: glycosyl hydrolase [Streptomyces]|uniref:glycosyl hydrolase n=1 Tax=Streptomyces scabiei TaxID=1930 RepID=UPI0004E6B50F|nr:MULTISPECIES: glycosyl hydrolase [Streptomyces]KFG10784.1 alpha-mannosidase [Streptomyces scabiei]MBP5879561.1 alpha-mannosidase [Streptomyces sp. LBUM 1477]MBP5887396.1 alpha-mannosidase [Streptomyces sp. LBUM 1487]MBP5890025.1 alpha-mannosidase [Streptomyces sp. LBUM 1481]MBP5903389.1 alpha-mannosidase [Streptomyces sp. LBUM 1488]
MPSSPLNRRTFVLLGAAVAAAAGTRTSVAAPAAVPGTPTPVRIVDDRATPATRALFAYLRRQRGRGILFGHQHDLTYGFTFTTPDGRASDTRAAVGDYPAVFGWDTLVLDGDERPGTEDATDAENIAALSRCIRQGDARGGINTLSAHMPNFVTGKDFYDTRGRVVGQILPGGAKHARFNRFLDRVAKAVKGARRPDGTLIPVIFRPFHENNGGWFWWGAGHTTSGEFIELFRYTVEYLRDIKGVHNLLYAYSPNASLGGDPAAYLRTYPGDRFVDVLGYDSYDEGAGPTPWLDGLVRDLAMVVRLANERGKVPAFTEFGESGTEIRDPQWFTRLLRAVEADPLARQVTYMATWANFGGTKRAYVPYPGHALLPDFVRFHQDPLTLFAADLRGVFAARTTAVRNGPSLHLVTPTDRQRVTAARTTVRVRVTPARASRVTYSVDGGPARRLRLDADGYHSGVWSIGPALRRKGSATLTVRARAGGETLTDSAVVLLGEAAPLPAGWIDDFEGYAGDDVALGEAYTHLNTHTLGLSREHKSSGSYGLAYAYDFTAAEFTGIGRPVVADWSAFTSLALWLRGDGSENAGALEIVADGIPFQYRFALDDTSGRELRAPFGEFGPAPWDTGNAGAVLDAARLAKVTGFNLYLGRASETVTKGVVYVDAVRAE